MLFAGAVLLSSCNKIFPDKRDSFLPDETVYINVSSTVVTPDVESGTYEISIIKSGKGYCEADVALTLDPDALDNYNAAHGTAYVMVPENLLEEFPESAIHFSKKDVRRTAVISWNPTALSTYLKLGKYVIPVSISCDGLEVSDTDGFIIIAPKR